MGIINFLFNRNKKSEPEAIFSPYWNGENMVPFDGEKTPYELGEPVSYYLDYYRIRTRSWEAFLKSDVIQNAVKKYILWIIGSGLKLQAAPVEEILQSGDMSSIISQIEANFRLLAKLNNSSYSLEWDLHKSAQEALKNAIISGDVLCILRYNKKQGVNIEIVDGYFVQNPSDLQAYEQATQKGNIIDFGVELNKKGSHVAYYVNDQRVPAYKNGRRYAWLFYGLNYKKDTVRGMSLLTAILETSTKLDRYKDATLGNAEENSKIPYSIEHNQFSTGENPLINQLAQSMGKDKAIAPETDSYNQADGVATKIAQTTNKQVYNMPIGSKLNRNDFKSDDNFADFFDKNSDLVYSTFGIPPEVANDKFGGSYSSSRASLKSWEYKMLVDRENLMEPQFYKPFYNFWLDIQALTNKINIPNYLEAYNNKDYMSLAAFRNCRFIGSTVPHIDPYKEVNAERLKLGETFRNVPLTSVEQACEKLNTGDFDAIIKKTQIEKNISNEFINQEQNERDTNI